MSQVRQIIREAITELIDDSRCIDCGYITNEDLRKWFGKGGAGGTTKGGWDRYLSLIHISSPRDLSTSRMPSSA